MLPLPSESNLHGASDQISKCGSFLNNDRDGVCGSTEMLALSYTDTCSMPIVMYFLGQFCCCLQLTTLFTDKRYDVAHVVMDMYIPTKRRGFISFGSSDSCSGPQKHVSNGSLHSQVYNTSHLLCFFLF